MCLCVGGLVVVAVAVAAVGGGGVVRKTKQSKREIALCQRSSERAREFVSQSNAWREVVVFATCTPASNDDDTGTHTHSSTLKHKNSKEGTTASPLPPRPSLVRLALAREEQQTHRLLARSLAAITSTTTSSSQRRQEQRQERLTAIARNVYEKTVSGHMDNRDAVEQAALELTDSLARSLRPSLCCGHELGHAGPRNVRLRLLLRACSCALALSAISSGGGGGRVVIAAALRSWSKLR